MTHYIVYYVFTLRHHLYRVMAVMDPVKVVVTNRDSVQEAELEVPNIPHFSDKGTHKVTFDPCDLYMERTDVREVWLHWDTTQ